MGFMKRMAQKMNKHIMAYSAGSILGRAVYKSGKSVSNSSNTSIFGKRVYKSKGGDALCENPLKRAQK